MVYSRKEFLSNWATPTNGNMRGIALLLEPGKDFIKTDSRGKTDQAIRLRVIADYLLQHKRRLWLVTSCLFLGCLMQLVMPFLTQSIVDIGIRDKDINFIWLVLLGELAIVIGRTATDFIRRWLLAHLSIKVNISMLSAFLQSYSVCRCRFLSRVRWETLCSVSQTMQECRHFLQNKSYR